MAGPAFRRGESVALHTVEEEDLEFLGRLRNDPEIRFGMTFSTPESERELTEWFEDHVSQTDGEGAQFLVVPEEGDGSPVGFVSLFDVQRPASHGEVACYVAPAAQGRGYATEATELLVGHAIEERRLHRVVARALVDNEASRAVLREVGFTEEETQREEKLVDGEFVDVIRHSVLEYEWGGR